MFQHSLRRARLALLLAAALAPARARAAPDPAPPPAVRRAHTNTAGDPGVDVFE